jgi:hypothetical protein
MARHPLEAGEARVRPAPLPGKSQVEGSSSAEGDATRSTRDLEPGQSRPGGERNSIHCRNRVPAGRRPLQDLFEEAADCPCRLQGLWTCCGSEGEVLNHGVVSVRFAPSKAAATPEGEHFEVARGTVHWLDSTLVLERRPMLDSPEVGSLDIALAMAEVQHMEAADMVRSQAGRSYVLGMAAAAALDPCILVEEGSA